MRRDDPPSPLLQPPKRSSHRPLAEYIQYGDESVTSEQTYKTHAADATQRNARSADAMMQCGAGLADWRQDKTRQRIS